MASKLPAILALSDSESQGAEVEKEEGPERCALVLSPCCEVEASGSCEVTKNKDEWIPHFFFLVPRMLLVVRPEAPSSVLAPSSKARSP